MRNTQSQRNNRNERINFVNRFLVFAISFIAIVLIIIFDRGQQPWQRNFFLGQPAPRSVYSPFDFSVLNEEKTTEAKDKADQDVLSVYGFDTDANRNMQASLNRFFDVVEKEKHAAETGELTAERAKVPVSDEVFQTFLQIGPSDGKRLAQGIFDFILTRGIITPEQKTILEAEGRETVSLYDSNTGADREVRIDEFIVTDKISQVVERRADKVTKDKKIKNALSEFVTGIVQPNIVFLEEETLRRHESAHDSTPSVYDKIQQDELIIARGHLVTDKDLSLIDAIEKKVIAEEKRARLAGVSLISLIAFLILGSYLYYFERDIYSSFRLVLLINVIFVMTVLFEKIAVTLPQSNVYFIPASLAALLLAVLIKPRLGILGAFMIAIFSGLLTDFKPDVLLFVLLGSLTGTYATVGLRKRSQFLKVGALIGVVSASCLFSYHILMDESIRYALELGLLGLSNGLLISMPLFFITMPIFEQLFGLTTDITLLELSDLNHPLLKRLVIEAPGTYHHSLVVANLAETACESIGADTLLARVGCYFHDIGKIEKAEYFSENQSMREASRHEKLSPSMSSLIIINHVKDGIELARKHKLKDVIVDFIPQHHGSSIVYYFYKKALEGHKEKDEETPADDYRYPGPKPRRKETAIALLADSVEAASRSLHDPTPTSLRSLVKKVINDKFIDGQLDECNLTLQDLRKIEESFTRSLMGIFHTRVEYPQEGKTGAKKVQT